MIAGASFIAAALLTISPNGADSHTFDRAYHAARANTVVYVQPGIYPAQQIGGRGRPVAFVGRGKVQVGKTELDGAANIEFRAMRISGWSTSDSDHITFRNVDTNGAFYINAPSSWISVIGGAVGPSRNSDSYIAVPDDSITQPSRHILIDGVRFHDVTRDPGEHVECLMLAQGVDVVIRNSVFTRCSVFDIFITWWSFDPPSDRPRRFTSRTTASIGRPTAISRFIGLTSSRRAGGPGTRTRSGTTHVARTPTSRVRVHGRTSDPPQPRLLSQISDQGTS